MRRVPLVSSYGILGSGRLARHLAFYLESTENQSKHKIFKWSRNGDLQFNSFVQSLPWERLQQTVMSSDVLLLAVADDGLAELIAQVRELTSDNKPLIHFSGAKEYPHTSSLHPLMTFTNSLYSIEEYSRIPFCEVEEGLFREVFPHLTNPTFHLSAEQKSLYHAYLVVAGNFTSLLWRDVEAKFVQKLKLDSRLLRPYKEKVLDNILHNSNQAVTGPLIRHDVGTMEANKTALLGDPLHALYEAFEKAFAHRKDPQ